MSRMITFGLCVMLLSMSFMTGCMGFGGSAAIIATREPETEVKGPKTLGAWDKFRWPAYNGVKKRVSLGTVKNGTSHRYGKDYAVAVEAELHNVIAKSNRFLLLERREDDVKGMLREADMGAAGMVNNKTAVRTNFLGAAFSISAVITQLQDHAGGGAIGGIGANDKGFGGFKIGGKRCEATIQIQIKDNQTGVILKSFPGKGYDAKPSFGIGAAGVGPARLRAGGLESKAATSLDRAVRRGVSEAVLNIVNSMGGVEWKGTVVKIKDDETLIVKGGKNMNLQSGMRMKVHHIIEALTDPDTGENLGYETEEVATVVIGKILEKASYAKLETGTLDDVEASDFLTMIKAEADPAGADAAGGL